MEKETTVSNNVPSNASPIDAEKEQARREKMHNWCETSMNTALEQSSLLNHIISEMNNFGCKIHKPLFYQCAPCPFGMAEGFYDKELGVVVCENNIVPTVNGLKQILIHETIHAYDYCTKKIDLNDCEHIACTEIRANTLSGQCDFTKEVRRGNFHLFAQKKKCAKRRAILSLESVPHCQSNARSAVERAFRQCYKDPSPFPSFPHDPRQ